MHAANPPRRRRPPRPRRRRAQAPTTEPEPDVHANRGTLARDTAAHTIHGGDVLLCAAACSLGAR